MFKKIGLKHPEMIKSLALFSFGMKWVEGLVFEVLKLSEKNLNL